MCFSNIAWIYTWAVMRNRELFAWNFRVHVCNFYTGRGISLIVVGLLLRILASYFLVLGNGFNIKEKLFIAIAWLPKATVQVSDIKCM